MRIASLCACGCIRTSHSVKILRRIQGLDYTYNVDVTSYTDGVRRTHNSNADGSTGRANADEVGSRPVVHLRVCNRAVLVPQHGTGEHTLANFGMTNDWPCNFV